MDASRGLAMTFAGVVLPNVLSAVRIGCAALFPFVSTEARLALVIVAAISDGLDGLLARAFGGTTWWGGLIDAAGDKIFAVTVIVDLTARGQLAGWQTLLLLMRDGTVITILITLSLMRRWQWLKRAAPGPLGKVTTAILFVTFLALIGWPQRTTIVHPLLVGAVIFSGLAAVDYAVRLYRAGRGTADRRA